MLHQRVNKRCITLILATIEPLIEAANILSTEAFYNDHHYVFLALHQRIRRMMDRRIDGIELLFCIVVWHLKDRFINSTNEREWSIEHDGCLLRTFHILVGIADGDGAHGCGESASHTCNTERHKDNKTNCLYYIISCHRFQSVGTLHSLGALALGHAVEIPQCSYQHHADEY